MGGTLWAAYANDSANNNMRHGERSGLNDRASYNKNIAHQNAAASTKGHANEENQCRYYCGRQHIGRSHHRNVVRPLWILLTFRHV